MKKNSDYALINQKVNEYSLNKIIPEKHYPSVYLRNLSKGVHIFNQNEAADYFYILLKGKVRVYQTRSNGKMVVVNIISKTRVFGDVELVCDKPTLSSVDLLEDSEFIMIPMNYCRNQMLNDIVFVKEIARYLALNLHRIETNFTITTSFTLEKESSATSFPLKLTAISNSISKHYLICSERLIDIF